MGIQPDQENDERGETHTVKNKKSKNPADAAQTNEKQIEQHQAL